MLCLWARGTRESFDHEFRSRRRCGEVVDCELWSHRLCTFGWLGMGVRPSGSKVELNAAIRRDAGAVKSARAIQREYRVSWTTVRKALGSARPTERKQYPNRGSKIDDYREVIDGWLRADLTAPRKQRHTAKRIFDRMREEQQAEVSYSRVRAYVAVRRGQILAESGRAPVEVFVPRSHRPGEEAEVDFGDVVVEL